MNAEQPLNSYIVGIDNSVSAEESSTPAPVKVPKKRGRKASGKAKVKTVSKTAMDEKNKKKLMDKLNDFLLSEYGECLKVIPYEDSTSAKNYAFACPIANEDGSTTWIKVEVSLPRGNRSTKDGYNGYDMAEKYNANVTGGFSEEYSF